MSIVYLAEDLKLIGKQWAVKQTGPHQSNIFKPAEEAELLTRLDHPNLPKIADWCTDHKGYGYLIMEVIRGRTLREKFIECDRKLPIPILIEYAGQLCDALTYLHGRRPRPIIFRDLKPSNIMIDERNQIRLIDFGIARDFKRSRQADTMQIGTIGFASPEQFENRQTDARSDLYSLGALLYYLLTHGTYFYTTGRRLQTEDGCPPALCRLVNRLLAHDPDKRIQTADEVHKALSDLQSSGDRMAVDFGISGERQSVGRAHDGRAVLAVIGSLYPGAGSTFLAEALAAVLSSLHVSNAVIEHPANSPELYLRLNGEGNAPEGYRFWAESALHGREQSVSEAWEDQETLWFPLQPCNSAIQDMPLARMLEFVHSIKRKMIIIDVSHHFSAPAVQELALIADTVFAVAGPDPVKLLKPDTESALRCLENLQAKRELIWIANHMVPRAGKWMKQISSRFAAEIPSFPYADMIRTLWAGKSAAWDPLISLKLKEQLMPMLDGLYPWMRKGNKRTVFRKLFGHSKITEAP